MAVIDSPAQPPAGPKVSAGLQASADAPALATSELRDILERLGGVTGEGVDDAERIDQLSLLESIKGAASAAQARVTWPSTPPSARPRPLPGFRHESAVAGSPPRWPSPDATRRPAGRGTLAWPGR